MDRWQHSSPCWKPPRVSRGSSSSAPPGQPLLPKPGWICESPEHLHEACFSARRLKRTCWGTQQVSNHLSKYFTQLTNNFQNDHGNLQNLKAYCSWSMLSMSGFRQLSKKQVQLKTDDPLHNTEGTLLFTTAYSFYILDTEVSSEVELKEDHPGKHQ